MQECCQAVHLGAWAPTAMDLARARHSALMLGNDSFLASSTHPESLDLIGNERIFKANLARDMKWYQECKVRVIDLCHGPELVSDVESGSLNAEVYDNDGDKGDSSEVPDSWLIIVALEFGIHPRPLAQPAFGSTPIVDTRPPLVYMNFNRYSKVDGKWMYMSNMSYIPSREPFGKFYERYNDGVSVEDSQMESTFGFHGRPAQMPTVTTPWHTDRSYQGKGWLYMDDLRTDGTDNDESEAGAYATWLGGLEARAQYEEALRDPIYDLDTWMFRDGRFRKDVCP